ncbi:hypothetical protein ACL9RI_19150 [Janthinobacterium sp. Mn2066]|uniref:GAP1-N1 domain-containing protein n=1 Tax=Janthinobacterium sp. Mn2066 TaxID=3395264 RepID=UPI003BE3E0C2
MNQLEQQLHGYRHGHELLSASVTLPKTDQDLIDRLSDVAGPLRPDEKFEPYFTCYPLPSGLHYVFACTWQDLEAPRAGCVRTRSFIVPMREWMTGINIVGLAANLVQEGPWDSARSVDFFEKDDTLPYVPRAEAVELVEALFLEERKPIVVFDSSNASAITLRVLAGVWPALRRSLAVSSFALSPRTIAGRSFDLMFAPKEARSRFHDWSGRKIDANKQFAARHRWTAQIIERMFDSSDPTLLRNDSIVNLMPEDGGTEAEFRISLLWNELQERLETSPNAALGLLDIANSRSSRNIDAIRQLEPKLGKAAQKAIAMLPSSEAWRFLLALTDKLKDIRVQLSVAKSIRGAAVQLAKRQPIDAIANAEMLATARRADLLLGAVGDGIAENLDAVSASQSAELQPKTFLQLLLLSASFADTALSNFPLLIEPLSVALAEASHTTLDEAKRRLLRLLTNDFQAEAAAILIAELSHEELVKEVRLLHAANALSAIRLHEAISRRAQLLGVVPEICDEVAEFVDSPGALALLDCLLTPTNQNVFWILNSPKLSSTRRLAHMHRILDISSQNEFRSMMLAEQRGAIIYLLLRDTIQSVNALLRIIESDVVDGTTTVDLAMKLLPYVDGIVAEELALKALQKILIQKTNLRTRDVFGTLITTLGARVSASWIVKVGFGPQVPGEVVTENLLAIDSLPSAIRKNFLLAVEDIANAIVERRRVDYDEAAVAAASNLLWDSAKISRQSFEKSCATILPFLFRVYRDPVSKLVAVAYPSVYLELKKSDIASDFFKLFLFEYWGKSQTLRHELVAAFSRSNWHATDIALAAARAGDCSQILKEISRLENGFRVISEIKRDLGTVPAPWRDRISKCLAKLYPI